MGAFARRGARRSLACNRGMRSGTVHDMQAPKHAQLVGMSNFELASEDLATLYLSLRMALAFDLVNRIDLHVYV
eukprot:9476289-Pyramimonas_sp.AAC.1